VRRAETEDLLDRITVYRAGIEPEALELIEAECARAFERAEIEATGAASSQTIPLPDGTVSGAVFCDRPALEQGWAGIGSGTGAGVPALLLLLRATPGRGRAEAAPP